ncbi:hypothetical protein [Polaribacter tangerinus]|uniref:hypothetical protein n=1 Tax=Polaribacter tangerinus TaxID=1920034 RepID=UPI00117E22C6|nr:hypothetical protein [Polaribacter tangerinus]
MENNLQNKISYDIENNNLIINSSKSLKNLYDNLKSGEKFELELIKSFYNKGFFPMELVSIATKEEIEYYKKKKIENFLLYKSKKNSNLNENIINNDNFATILSEDGEVQVGDSIYKYTSKGLLIAHIKKRALFETYTKKSSNNLFKSNSDVFLYTPDRNNLLDFNVEQADECDLNATISSELILPSEFYGCGGGGSVSGGTSTVGGGIRIPDTSNYSECVNSKSGWIDNIFGRSYVCEYFFNDDKKLRTIFEAADYYFFQDVYAQAKFKNNTWFGWFSDRSADEVYLLNKKVILNTKTEKRGFDFAIDWEDTVKVFNKIYTFFLSKPDNTITYVSNEYDFNTNTVTTHLPNPDNLLNLASNSLNLITPQIVQKTPLIDIDFNLKNFFGTKVNKAVTINVLSLKYNLSNTDIIKLAHETLAGKKIKLDKGETGAIIIVYVNPKTMEAKPVAFSLFGEKTTVSKLAVAARDFDVPQNFKIDDFSVVFKSKHYSVTNSTKNSIGVKFKFRIDVVNSVDIEIESGAYYKGVWGGSKFKVQY